MNLVQSAQAPHVCVCVCVTHLVSCPLTDPNGVNASSLPPASFVRPETNH